MSFFSPEFYQRDSENDASCATPSIELKLNYNCSNSKKCRVYVKFHLIYDYFNLKRRFTKYILYS